MLLFLFCCCSSFHSAQQLTICAIVLFAIVWLSDRQPGQCAIISNLEHRSHSDTLLLTNPVTTQLASRLDTEREANESDSAVCPANGTE